MQLAIHCPNHALWPTGAGSWTRAAQRYFWTANGNGGRIGVVFAGILGLTLWTQASAEETGAPSVDKIVICTSVESRKPVGEGTEFGDSVGRLYCWTKITAKNAPTTLKHIWSVDGKKAAEIPLSIKYPSFRTWSNKAIWPGAWKVEVVSESGETLTSLDFTVK